MTKQEIITLRMNILGGMNTYILEVIGDDYITAEWLCFGIPDECDEELLYEIAEDERDFSEICALFGQLTKTDFIENKRYI